MQQRPHFKAQNHAHMWQSQQLFPNKRKLKKQNWKEKKKLMCFSAASTASLQEETSVAAKVLYGSYFNAYL